MANSYKKILQRCLERIPANRDKREGAIIYDALAPASAELAQMYMFLELLINRAFLDTQTGGDLDLKAKEFGVTRHPATYAVRRGEFKDGSGNPFNIPLGSRFTGGEVNYYATEKIDEGIFRMTCETAGEAGNIYFGRLLPIVTIQGLGSAELGEMLIPGETTENDHDLRQRVYDVIEGEAFGGNIKDYKTKVLALPGVGQVKVFPVWNGGGSVRLVIVDSAGGVPSETLVNEVQTAIDPETNHGEGIGLAPIGHTVTVVGATGDTIDLKTHIELKEGYQWADVLPDMENVVNAYFQELIKKWQEADSITLRVSQIESRILDVEGVEDIQDTEINGSVSNYILGAEEIPVLGTVNNT